MNNLINYEALQEEIENNSISILNGNMDNLLAYIEEVLERNLIANGQKSNFELLSYVKYKLNKGIESFYYGLESFKSNPNSIGILYAAISILKINRYLAPKFLFMYKESLHEIIHSNKANRNILKSDYEFNIIDNYLKLGKEVYRNENINTDFIKKIRSFSIDDGEVKINSYRAKGMVNCHVIEVNGEFLIVDCGAEIVNDNLVKIDLDDFLKNVNKKKIKGAIISHAHLDHYGSLDVLKNYTDNIYMTEDTNNLINLSSNILKIYEKINHFQLYKEFRINNDIEIVAIPNGHILGSVAFFINFKGKNIFYSGDFCFENQNTVSGLREKSIESLINQKGKIDYLIMESTYGFKDEWLSHAQRKVLFKYFTKLSYDFGIKIFIPSFAIGRSQECASILSEDRNMYINIDGLASRITNYYNNYSISSNLINEKIMRFYNEEDIEDKFNQSPITIASSGMLKDESTSYKYYKYVLNNKMTTVIKCGYMDNNLYKYKLDIVDGININVIDINLSAHAQYEELIRLINIIKPENLIIVHGNGIKGIKNK